MKNLSVSILIPTYNQERFISNAIISALNQDYDNLSIVILDDSSTDKTYDIAKSFESKDKRVRVYRNEENLGRTKTYRRLLYELNNSNWVVMLDGDDYFINSSFIKKAVDIVLNYKDIFAVLGGYIKKENKMEIKNVAKRQLVNGFDVFLKYPDIVYSHGSLLFNAEIAKKIDAYRLGIMSDDLDTHLRLFMEGNVYFLDEIVYVWQIHGQNETVKKGYNDYLLNIKTLIDSVSNHAVFKFPDKKDEIFRWKKKAFFKLYRIALSMYGNSKLSVSKIFNDIKEYFNFYYFITSGTFVVIALYLIFPQGLFVLLRDFIRRVRKF